MAKCSSNLKQNKNFKKKNCLMKYLKRQWFTKGEIKLFSIFAYSIKIGQSKLIKLGPNHKHILFHCQLDQQWLIIVPITKIIQS